MSFEPSFVLVRRKRSERLAPSWTASFVGASRPRPVLCVFAFRKMRVAPARAAPAKLPDAVSYEPNPGETVAYRRFAGTGSRLVTMLITAPCRCPPNSAGKAPVKISSESMLCGSISSEKFALVVCGTGAPSTS